jgi:hypothetical protein
MMGISVFEVLINHPQLISINNEGQKSPATLETLKSRFGVEEIGVGMAIHVDKDDNFVDLWKNNMVLGYVNRKPGEKNKKDLSYGYTFQLNNHPYCDEVDINPGKVIAERSTDIVKSQILGPEAGYLIQNCI